ncbi:class I SAM-dependent methyltransferase [Actinomadura sp. ATCC 31491]|uniref:Class I SAM-dependent methyltransferase n=1 Tax=Actinomadura luzonensis TaxID=2805427 RepID=A0ABT0G3C4_9ACTN|nr:class I SAM-dependent methyltransferase [Actinomadura luzonensis]MCK2219107.1 class I SAM-dependent methyltransferase [Actinomadura luzonensis]
MPNLAAHWDAAADTFDEEADHGLRDPAVRAAWAARLATWLPPAAGRRPDALDLGCGTGSLSLLLAEAGHRVTGVDLAPRMVERAREKLAGTDATVTVGDASRPPVGERRFDVVLTRHVVWALPDPERALARWAALLRPGGRLVLVEGRWSSVPRRDDMPWDGGITAEELVAALRRLPVRFADLRVDRLTEPVLWGKEIDDERYAVVAATPAT